MKCVSIAIDGPAGAGKSTLARKTARELGFLYVDTGAIYRTVALKVLRAGADPTEESQVIPLLKGLDISMDYGPDGEQQMFLEGEDVSKAIREHQISGLASKGSAIPAVRDFLLEFQRTQAREHNVVMDGRDIGTVVLPQADVKIFLTAAPESRARRRLLELEGRGQKTDFETVLRDIVQRDEQDRNRPIAPLRQAEDAVLLDTTRLNLEESLAAMLSLIKEKIHLTDTFPFYTLSSGPSLTSSAQSGRLDGRIFRRARQSSVPIIPPRGTLFMSSLLLDINVPCGPWPRYRSCVSHLSAGYCPRPASLGWTGETMI